QKATYDGTTFYRVHLNLGGAMQGWIKEKDLTLYRLTNPTTHTKKYTVARKNDYLLTNPWGNSYLRIAQLINYGKQAFQAPRTYSSTKEVLSADKFMGDIISKGVATEHRWHPGITGTKIIKVGTVEFPLR